MKRYALRLLPVSVLLFVAAACAASKSSNPLSPDVAGPIPGVGISAPTPVTPTAGSQIAVDQQPITLKVQNATTNGVRPLSYTFQVASDSNFSTILFSKAGISPGDGQTTVTLGDTLAAEHMYYWRSQALDGANTGPYSGAVSFTVYTPVVINPPGLVSPIGGAAVSSDTPTLTVNDASHSGPAGAITYLFQVAKDQAFTSGLVQHTSAEGSSQTTYTVGSALADGTTYYWHVQASDGSHSSNWSNTESFVTPAASAPPSGGGTSGGGTSGGATGPGNFNLNSVQIIGGSPDIRSWPATGQITNITFSPGNFHIDYTKNCQWPGVDIGGGTLQAATVWFFQQIGGQWYGTGGERLRPCQEDKGLDNPSDISTGWFYSSQWSPMTGHVPAVGETVGFMVVAGSTRADSHTIVQERTGVVLIPFPRDGVTTSYPPFTWQEQ
jgi:hypothetical protein